jgi:hypothetical protein
MDTGFQASRTVIAGRTGYAVPLIVAVTGHRNLVPAEIPEIRKRVREFLSELCEKYPDRGVSVMSPLAAGADQIVAEEAITLRIPLIGRAISTGRTSTRRGSGKTSICCCHRHPRSLNYR